MIKGEMATVRSRLRTKAPPLLSLAPALVRTLAGNDELEGMDVCEFAPSRDVQGLTACIITRLLMNAIGASARRVTR